MSRRGLRATAPCVASTWYNLGLHTQGNDGVRSMGTRTSMEIHMAWQTNKSSGARALVMAALPSFTLSQKFEEIGILRKGSLLRLKEALRPKAFSTNLTTASMSTLKMLLSII